MVVKTLWPGKPGTVQLRKRHGEALVCVRYRQDAKGIMRYTTVELLVDARPVRIRVRHEHQYGVQIWWGEADLARAAKAAGATWNPGTKLWSMPGKTVKQLGLSRRIRKR
jgi:hypothetical protein